MLIKNIVADSSSFGLKLLVFIFVFCLNPCTARNSTSTRNFAAPSIFNAKNDSVFYIGALFPLVSRDVRHTLADGINGVLTLICTIESINNNYSILPDLSLSYQVRDIGLTTAPNAGATTSLIADRNIVITLGIVDCFCLGTGNAFQTIDSVEFFSDYKIGYVDFAAPNYRIEGENYIRFTPSSYDLSYAVAELLVAMNWTLVSAVYGDFFFGTAIKRDFSQIANNKGVKIVCDTILPLAFGASNPLLSLSIANQFAFCLSSLSAEVNVVVIFASELSTILVLNAFWKIRSLRNIYFVIASTSFTPLILINTYAQSQFPASYLDGSINVIPNVLSPSIIRQCLSNFNVSKIDSPLLLDFWELSFRCILYDPSVSSVAPHKIPMCPERLVDRLFPPQCRCTGNESMSQMPINPTMSLIHDSVVAISLTLDRIINACNDNSNTTFNCEAITGVDIINEMQTISFTGLMGNISFRNNSLAALSFRYVQFEEENYDKSIGYLVDNTTRINYYALQFKGSKAIPPSAIFPEIVSLNSTGVVVIVSITILLMLICVITMGVIWYFRKEPPIKKSSPLFCILILLGILLNLGAIIASSVQTTTFSCNLALWLFYTGLGLILANIVAKTYRIFQIFSNMRVTTTAISDKDLLVFTASMLLIIIFFLALISAGSIEPRITYSTIDPLVAFYTCRLFDTRLSQVALYLLIVISLLLIFALSIFAYLTRNVDSEFNESRSIAIAIFTYVAVFIITFPVYLVTNEVKNSLYGKYYVLSISILVCMSVTLYAFFFSKLYFIYKEKQSYPVDNINNPSGETNNLVSPLLEDTRITEIETDTELYQNLHSDTNLSLFLTNELWDMNADK